MRQEVDKAAGNNLIEGQIVTDEEKEIVMHVLQKYDGSLSEAAIDSLLYGIAIKCQDGDENNVKRKK